SRGEHLTARRLWELAGKSPAVERQATIEMAQLFAEKELRLLAYPMLKEAQAKAPQVRALAQAAADRAEQLGLKEEAFARNEALYAADRGDLRLLRWFSGYFDERHDAEQALLWRERLLKLAPASAADIAAKARFLEGLGRIAEARAALEAALIVSPENTYLIERLADLEHVHGDTPRAIELWRRSLAIRPQNPDLMRYLEFLSPEAEGFEKAYAEDALALVAAYPPTPEAGETAEALLDLTVWKVFANGLSSQFQQTVLRVYTDSGVKAQRRVAIRYAPGVEEVRLLKARILRPDGTVLENYVEDEQDLSQGYSIYYDARAKVIDFPQLQPGDAMEVQYRIDDIGASNLYADYFGALRLVQGYLPIRKRRLAVALPKTRTLYYNAPRLIPSPAITEKGEDVEYDWRAENVPKVKSEPAMPPLIEVADYLHVSTFKDWQAMGEWYWNLVKDQFIAKESLKRTIRELVKGAADDAERIRRVYEWVVLNTRYVGLEFGIHSYKPYQVNDVFERKFGDCKDKATLMIVMLKEAGVRADLAIVRTSNIGAMEPSPPSLAMFNHAIAYLPDYDLWLDGTAEFSGVFELPYQDRRGQAMLVSDAGVRFTTVPTSAPAANVYRQRATIALGDGVDARLENVVEVRGTRASQFRSHFQDPKERKERLEKLINADHPGATLEKFAFEPLDDLSRAVRFEFASTLPAYIRQDNSNFAARATVDHVDLGKQFAALSKREHPVEIDKLQTLESTATFELGKKWTLVDPPEPLTLREDFADFAMTVAQEGDRLVVATVLTFKQNRIPLERYDAFRRFCEDVTRAYNQEIRLARAD
ncbi:MAG: DUF3857 domain-containing protein, partial [Myxococcales bacterium]